MLTEIKYKDMSIPLEAGEVAVLSLKNKLLTDDMTIIATTESEAGDPILQEKTATENGEVTPDEGYDGLSKVTVNVESSVDNTQLIGLIERTATEITVPDGVTSIGEYAFYNCSNLALTSLPDGVTSIGGHAFRGCSNLALTSLPDGVTSIGNSAFRGCSNLALTSLPDGVPSIEGYAFFGCSNLALTSLPDGVTSIGGYAFRDCARLTTITFEGTPTSIAGTAFDSCINLTTINVPWAEGEVADAPWGATNATINYNYTGE